MKAHYPALALLLIFITLSSPALSGQQANQSRQGKVLESLSFTSTTLDRDVKYSIYLPPGYDTSIQQYPVVYLLHGATDDETTWIRLGQVNSAADRAVASRQITPMIIVMPDAGLTWYINDYQSKVKYEDMFIQEFIPYIDKTYRTQPQKQYRGISGLSMGGYGSLIMAMRHPNLFTVCAAFSSAVQTDEEWRAIDEKKYEEYYAKVFGPQFLGKARLNDHYRKYSPLHQAKTLPEKTLKSVHWYIDCGDDDFLYKGNSALHVILRDRNIPHEYRVRDGAHNWAYWRTGITEALKFIAKDFGGS